MIPNIINNKDNSDNNGVDFTGSLCWISLKRWCVNNDTPIVTHVIIHHKYCLLGSVAIVFTNQVEVTVLSSQTEICKNLKPLNLALV